MCYGLPGTADECHSERASLCQHALGLALGWTLVQVAGLSKNRGPTSRVLFLMNHVVVDIA